MESHQVTANFYSQASEDLNDKKIINIESSQNGIEHVEQADENFSEEDEMGLTNIEGFTKPSNITIEEQKYEPPFLLKQFENNNDEEDTIATKKRKFSSVPGQGPHQCVFCGARFTSAANMNRHRKRHFNIKAFKCCICQKDFGRRDHLTQHLEIHLKTRPFTCAICNETFDAREVLKEHLITKHIDNNPEDKICKLCGHESQTSRGAKLHYTSRHFNNRLMIGELPHGYESSNEVSVILTAPEANSNQPENNNHPIKQDPEKMTSRRTPRKDKNPTKIVTNIDVDEEFDDDDDEEESYIHEGYPDYVFTRCEDDYNTDKDLNFCDTKCEACGIIFPDRTLYFLHKGFHTELDPWKCNICGQKCKDKYDFHVHLVSKAHR